MRGKGLPRYEVSHYQINIRREALRIGASCRLAFLTDLHNQASPAETAFLLETLAEEQIDAVLCGGDMIVANPGHSIAPGLHFMRALAKQYPVYAATGNHEYRARLYPEQYGTMYPSYMEGIREAGVHVLENACAEPALGGFPLRVYGFDMPVMYYQRFRHIPLPTREITAALGTPEDAYVNVLLAHNPAGKHAYFDWGADVTLCGHYHGGVMRLGPHRGAISPDFRLFPHANGQYQQEGKHVIISAGCGEHTIPVRICNPREVVILELGVS